jgi:hypothetical protein
MKVFPKMARAMPNEELVRLAGFLYSIFYSGSSSKTKGQSSEPIIYIGPLIKRRLFVNRRPK